MKLLAFSDLHRDLGQAAELVAMAVKADVVIGAGDFASVHEGLDQTIEALAAIETPTVLVPGNNETEQALREAASEWDAAIVLHGSGRAIEGTEFFGLGAGIPVTPWEWSFDLDDDAASSMLEPCPQGAVLVLHSPRGGTAMPTAPAIISAVRPCCRRSKRRRPAWRSAGISTSLGAVRARSASPRFATSARGGPGSRSREPGRGSS